MFCTPNFAYCKINHFADEDYAKRLSCSPNNPYSDLSVQNVPFLKNYAFKFKYIG